MRLEANKVAARRPICVQKPSESLHENRVLLEISLDSHLCSMHNSQLDINTTMMSEKDEDEMEKAWKYH